MTVYRKIKVGIIGLGAAAQAFLPAFEKHPGFELIGVCDPNSALQSQISAMQGVRYFSALTEMLQMQPDIELVYIASPTDLHLSHSLEVIAAGKHVLVEKPMANSLVDALKMVEASKLAGTILMVGHSHSYDRPILEMKRLIDGGSLGAVRMVNTWCYTDWMYRPRREEELDHHLGGGVTYRQGAHQFDIIRYLCSGLASSVRAKTLDMDPQRKGIGAHTVFIDFESGPCATAVYNGYAGFSTMEMGFDISEWGFEEPMGVRKWLQKPRQAVSAADELKAKRARAAGAIPHQAPYQPFFGVTLVSCELGDIRQTPKGLLVCGRHSREELVLSTDDSPRDLVLMELYGALVHQEKVVHSAQWGAANLEVCEAAIESSLQRKELSLKHQVSL